MANLVISIGDNLRIYVLSPEHCCVFIQDRGINNFANNTKLWVDQTKWTGFLARKGFKNVSFMVQW